MLTAYMAIDCDGTPALVAHQFPASDDGDACAAWLDSGIDRDEDGGALCVLAIVGKPGDQLEIKQDGVTVAVVVRS